MSNIEDLGEALVPSEDICLHTTHVDPLLRNEAVFSPSLEDHDASVFIFTGPAIESAVVVVVLPWLSLPLLRSPCLLSVRRLASVKASPLSDMGCLLGSDLIAASISQSRPPWKAEAWLAAGCMRAWLCDSSALAVLGKVTGAGLGARCAGKQCV